MSSQPRSFRIRLAVAAVSAIAAVSVLAGCAGGTTAASTVSTIASAATAPTTSNSTVTATAASASNTKLTSGSWTGTIGDKTVTLKAAYLVDGVDATIDGGTYASAVADQAVFLVVNGGHLTITNATITKSGEPADSSSDSYNFYGLNSAVVVVGSTSSVTMSNSSVTTASGGSNAIFATAKGTATLSDVTINTSKDSSRGLDATYEGVITAKNMTIHTIGAHCATLATDRGNGTVTVTGTNVLTTAGEGSPIVYSTGAISLSGATGGAKVSEVVVIEGKNSATITDSTLSSGGTNAAMLYQSMSGDAADANATASGSTLTLTTDTITHTGSGAVIFSTNATTNAVLTKVKVTSSATTNIKAAADRWGTSGSNGGKLTITLDGTTLSGATADSVSSIAVKTATRGHSRARRPARCPSPDASPSPGSVGLGSGVR